MYQMYSALEKTIVITFTLFKKITLVHNIFVYTIIVSRVIPGIASAQLIIFWLNYYIKQID